MIGYDVIVHAATRHFYLVDLNYLPSYNVVPNLRELMLAFLMQAVAKHVRRVAVPVARIAAAWCWAVLGCVGLCACGVLSLVLMCAVVCCVVLWCDV